MEYLFTQEKTDRRIVFISDLHFDFVADSSQENKHRFDPKLAIGIKDDFIKYVKLNYVNDILLLAGDFYNDFSKSLAFVKELEQNQIFGFFVLGNHDYWQKPQLAKYTHKQINKIFDKETFQHKYFRYLQTGKKYYVGDLCFIGDTGWTSFRRIVHRYERNQHISEVKNLKQFLQLPDASNTRNFDPKRIKQLHENWIKFANLTLKSKPKVIVLTHNPMFDNTQEEKDVWWSSSTDLLDTDNCWKIFGHTHAYRISQWSNNISKQRGYENKELKQNTPDLYNEIKAEIIKQRREQSERISAYYRSNGQVEKSNNALVNFEEIEIDEQEIEGRIKSATNQYLPQNFGHLIKMSDRRELSAPFDFVMQKYYTSDLVADPNEQTQLVKSVRSHGYRRPSANKHNFAYLAYDKEKYLKIVREVINATANKGDVRIGYYYNLELKAETIAVLNSAVSYLEHFDINDDVRSFITSAIITGYAFNGLPNDVANMRPVNDYDIVRFYLQFLTMKKYKINFKNIWTINRSQNKNEKIAFGNIEIPLPVINGLVMPIGEVMQALGQTPLLALVSPDGYKYKVLCKRCGAEVESTSRQHPDTCEHCRKQIKSAVKEIQAPKTDKERLEYYKAKFQEKVRNKNPNIEVVDYKMNGKYSYATFKCSVCGKTWTLRADRFYVVSYCLNCDNKK